MAELQTSDSKQKKGLTEWLYGLGIEPDMPVWKRSRIKIANKITFILMFVGVIYSVVSLIRGLPFWYIPTVGLMFSFTVFILHSFGAVSAGRIIAGASATMIATLYHAALLSPGETPIIASYIFTFGFALIPFVMFDMRERVELIISGIISLVLLLAVRPLAGVLVYEVDNSFAKAAGYEGGLVTVSFLLAAFMLLILQQTNLQADLDKEKLLEEMRERSKEIEGSELQMKEYLAELEERKKEEELRVWISNGVSEVSRVLQEQQDLDTMLDVILNFFIDKVEANQGALFLVEQEEQSDQEYLRLATCYAYDRKKFLNKRIEVGEGLVGQTMLEKATIHLSEIPQDYAEITSGLGQATPTALLLVPMVHNEHVLGVIELASFTKFEKHQVSFIERTAEVMASSLQNIRAAQRTRTLLEEVQKLNQEYLSQEEEMRQNMEELQATQEEMMRKEREYLQQIESLKA